MITETTRAESDEEVEQVAPGLLAATRGEAHVLHEDERAARVRGDAHRTRRDEQRSVRLRDDVPRRLHVRGERVAANAGRQRRRSFRPNVSVRAVPDRIQALVLCQPREVIAEPRAIVEGDELAKRLLDGVRDQARAEIEIL